MVKAITGIISGNSMHPALRMGWKVKAEPADKNNIKPGDIVVFGEDVLTCHRIIGKIKFFNLIYFIHKGDNSHAGGIFPAEFFIYRVIEVFNENNEKVDKAEWAEGYFEKPGNLAYVYLFLYFLKRCVFLRKTNKLTIYTNILLWSFLLKRQSADTKK